MDEDEIEVPDSFDHGEMARELFDDYLGILRDEYEEEQRNPYEFRKREFLDDVQCSVSRAFHVHFTVDMLPFLVKDLLEHTGAACRIIRRPDGAGSRPYCYVDAIVGGFFVEVFAFIYGGGLEVDEDELERAMADFESIRTRHIRPGESGFHAILRPWIVSLGGFTAKAYKRAQELSVVLTDGGGLMTLIERDWLSFSYREQHFI